MLQLVRRQRIAQLGIGLLPPERCVGLDHRPPLGIERLVGLPAGDDEAMDCSVALTLEPLLRPSLRPRSEEHTSELQSLMRISYAVFCLNNKTTHIENTASKNK